MKKLLSLILCGILMLSITGCGNNEVVDEINNDSSNSNLQENTNVEMDDEQTAEKYDKIIHCDIEAGVAGSLASEADGSYYEYYIKENKVVKYERFKVLPEDWSDKIDEYIKYLEEDGYKKVEKIGNNVKIIVESSEDAPEDNNPLTIAIYEVEEYPNKNSNCYIK